MRYDGRAPLEMRPITFTPDFVSHPQASVLAQWGNTRVLCSVYIENSVPSWIRQQKLNHGWLTAEYSMLPCSTGDRIKRERNFAGGRTQEIQRLIGRSIRGMLDLTKIQDHTIIIDCDVIEADGGTRTTAINGASLALEIALRRFAKKMDKPQNHPALISRVAAVSIGICKGELLVDLNYKEDQFADLDMNLVLNEKLEFLEIQGTGEKTSFSKEQLFQVVEATTVLAPQIFKAQIATLQELNLI